MLTTTSDSVKSIKLAVVILLITNRGVLGDIGFIAFYLICVLFILRDGLYFPVLKYIGLLIIPVVISIFTGLLRRHEYYDIFKDVYYFLSPIFTTYVGCIIAHRTKLNVLKQAFLIVGIFVAVIFILQSVTESGVTAFLDPRTSRVEESLYLNSAAFLSLGVLMWNVVIEKNLKHTKWNLFLLMLNIFTVYMSGSRTYYVAALAFVLIISFPYIKRHILKFAMFIGIIIIGLTALIMTNPDNNTVTTILHSSDEITVGDYKTASERNNNYRGYEAFRALDQFNNYPTRYKIFGGGFGEKIDMVISPLGPRYIPIIHNGYPYILIKNGFLGMACFILFGYGLICRMHKMSNYGSNDLRMLCFMAIGGIVVSFIVNASVWGLFNDAYNILLMLGGMYLYYLNNKKYVFKKRNSVYRV